jgi:lipopolysaccharide heptosyltransferase II
LLIRGVNWLGDAIMTTPALWRLRQALPNTRITLLTQEKLGQLWSGQSMVDEVVTFQPREGLWGVARRLRAGHHDTGLALPNSHRSALELWLARIPRRIGLRAPARNWFLTDAVERHPGSVRMRKRSSTEIRRRFSSRASPERPPPQIAHQIHHYLHLAAALGANPAPAPPRLAIASEILGRVRSTFQLDPGTAWLGLNPGAEYGAAKRWPANRFAKAASQIQRQTGCRCLILGGRADRELAQHVERSIARLLDADDKTRLPVNLAGRTDLQELCAALKCCRVLLTNDTGPMHVAAALGVAVVVPFGSTSPELTGPGLPGDPRHRLLRHQVPCSPGFKRICTLELQCLAGISVDEVVAAVQSAGGWS